MTHSKEVAAFANRSLELRDGRFVAEHGEGVDVENLSQDRELIIDKEETVTASSDLLVRRWRWPLHRGQCQQRVPLAARRGRRTMGKMELASVCPACKHDYGDSEDQNAPRAVQVDPWSRSNREALGGLCRVFGGFFLPHSHVLCHAAEVHRWQT